MMRNLHLQLNRENCAPPESPLLKASARPRKRVFFVNRFFHPDHSATSQILSDLAFYLSAERFDVHIITSTGAYDDPAVNWPAEEQTLGLTIHRVCAAKRGRGSLLGRVADYLAMYLAFGAAVLRLLSVGDILIAKTDPPLLSVVLLPIAKVKKLTLINWLQDLYPEVAERLRVAGVRGPIGRVLAFLRNASLRGAATNVVIGERMGAFVTTLGVPPERIAIIPNWCDDKAITPRPRDNNALRNAWGLQGKFIVGYSGNLGRAHEYETLLAAAETLRHETDIVFLFIGGGHLTAELKAAVERRGLWPLFQFRPYQHETVLPLSLSLPDVHWLSLLPEMEGLIVPSKFYGIAAAGRPTISVSDPDGEVARLVRRFDCGIAVAPGDSVDLARQIQSLRSDPAMAERQGRNARAMIDHEFTRLHSLTKWEHLLSRTMQGAGSIRDRAEIGQAARLET